MSTAPVFLLAAPFSGASMLAARLGPHPDLCVVPELGLFMADRIGELLDIVALDRGPALDGLLRALAVLEFGESSDRAIDAARSWLAVRADRPVGFVIAHLAACAAPRRLVIPDSASPLRPMDLHRLRRHSPDAALLHLVRHPWTQGCLLAAWAQDRLFVPPDYKDHGVRPPQVDPQIPWLRANRNLDAMLGVVPVAQRYRLNDESLAERFEDGMAALCAWLGVDSSAEALATLQSPEDWGFAGYGPGTAPQGLEAEVLEPLPEADRALAAQPSLDAALPWRPDGQGFAPEVRALARGYGYEEGAAVTDAS